MSNVVCVSHRLLSVVVLVKVLWVCSSRKGFHDNKLDTSTERGFQVHG